MNAYTHDGDGRTGLAHEKRVRTCTCGKMCWRLGGWNAHWRSCPELPMRPEERCHDNVSEAIPDATSSALEPSHAPA